jgi:hypothetical protein
MFSKRIGNTVESLVFGNLNRAVEQLDLARPLARSASEKATCHRLAEMIQKEIFFRANFETQRKRVAATMGF